ncbi:uncharacterized protein LOC130258376 [Oenanthe melanoleuca]|uniref:uncharacterized protein LOC130258376 n=1 Tax=Oenanthe melanoleuca TaxID=2939378 RepID=UPI0024C1391B|nr:uncharacterized protein LOC130258376 [Oenanthe melanoleuca]
MSVCWGQGTGVCEGPRTGDRVCECPRTGDRVCEWPRTGDRVCEGPRTGDRVCEGPRTGDRVCELPRTGDRVCEGPRTGDRVCEWPRTGDRVCEGPRTGDRVCEGPRTATVLHRSTESRTLMLTRVTGDGNHGMAGVGRQLPDPLIPPLPWQGHLPAPQGAPGPVQPGLDTSKDGDRNISVFPFEEGDSTTDHPTALSLKEHNASPPVPRAQFGTQGKAATPRLSPQLRTSPGRDQTSGCLSEKAVWGTASRMRGWSPQRSAWGLQPCQALSSFMDKVFSTENPTTALFLVTVNFEEKTLKLAVCK